MASAALEAAVAQTLMACTSDNSAEAQQASRQLVEWETQPGYFSCLMVSPNPRKSGRRIKKEEQIRERENMCGGDSC